MGDALKNLDIIWKEVEEGCFDIRIQNDIILE